MVEKVWRGPIWIASIIVGIILWYVSLHIAFERGLYVQAQREVVQSGLGEFLRETSGMAGI